MKIFDRVKLVESDEETDILTALCDYAEMGYSRAFVAKIWGFNVRHFRNNVLPKIDPEKEAKWRPRQDTVDWRESMQGVVGNPAGLKPKVINVNGHDMTYADLAKATGLSIRGARDRYKSGRNLMMPKMSRHQVAKLGAKASRRNHG